MSEEPSKEINRLRAIIKELREYIYYKTVHKWSPEREWETEEQGKLREEQNKITKMKFDNDTLRMCGYLNE